MQSEAKPPGRMVRLGSMSYVKADSVQQVAFCPLADYRILFHIYIDITV